MEPVVMPMSLRPWEERPHLVAFSGQRAGAAPLGFGLVVPRVSQVWERLLVLPSLSTFRAARPRSWIDLSSFGNGRPLTGTQKLP